MRDIFKGEYNWMPDYLTQSLVLFHRTAKLCVLTAPQKVDANELEGRKLQFYSNKEKFEAWLWF